MLVFGEREKSKAADRLVVKVRKKWLSHISVSHLLSQVWLPLDQVSVEQLAEDPPSMLSPQGSLSALPRLTPGSGGSGAGAGGAAEGSLSKRAQRKETKETPIARELRDCVCLAVNGAQFFVTADDKGQLALWLKKLHKKLALIKQYA